MYAMRRAIATRLCTPGLGVILDPIQNLHVESEPQTIENQAEKATPNHGKIQQNTFQPLLPIKAELFFETSKNNFISNIGCCIVFPTLSHILHL